MSRPRALVACEESGRVRDALTRAGFDAMSCDMLPTRSPGRHYQGDVLDVLYDGWDLLIAHPPCTYLASSGLHWNKRIAGRAQLTEESLVFVQLLLDAPIHHIALENPTGCISTRIREPDQIVQPWMFGDDASKATCFWLKNLDPLVPTKYYPPGGFGQGQMGDAVGQPDRQRAEQARAVGRQSAVSRTKVLPTPSQRSGAGKCCSNFV